MGAVQLSHNRGRISSGGGLQLSWRMFSAFRKGEKYKDHFASGVYECAKCGYELFSSAAKYAHQSPWPAFSDTFHPDSVTKVEEKKGALKVSCGRCGEQLGHEFLGDGPRGKSRF